MSNKYQSLVEKIKNGGQPAFVGMSLSKVQISDIRLIIDNIIDKHPSKKDELNDYYKVCVLTRLRK